jgi:hypothetical protein
MSHSLRCGLVALAMAMTLKSYQTTVECLFNRAKELSLTMQGELFDGNDNSQHAVYLRQ